MRKVLIFILLFTGQIAWAQNNFVGKVGEFRTLYLTNDNIFYGEILSINEDGTVEIDTEEGVLSIPAEQILEETLKIKKNNGTSFSGKINGESEVYIKLRTEFGDASRPKHDISRESSGRVSTVAATSVLPGAAAEAAGRLQVRAVSLRRWGALDRSSDSEGFAAAASEVQTKKRYSDFKCLVQSYIIIQCIALSVEGSLCPFACLHTYMC
jgi:hypothetical protein